MAKATFHFPPDFLWGTATAAHQVEGDNRNNDWWAWEQQGGGRIFGDHTSGRACEWWAGRAEEDIARMKALHNNAHRLSIEWSRIEPKEGRWDYAALDRYRAILRAMREAGIEPLVTLHHFTSPLWFAHRGGWLHPDAPHWFARFVRCAVGELADLVTLWCTVNEPNVYAGKGYFAGEWPPGMKDLGAYFRVLKNMLLGHAAAYRVIHEIQPQAQAGLALNVAIWQPHSRWPTDRFAAHLLDHAFNRIIWDALDTGEWRPLLSRREALGEVKGTQDWVGVNYYMRYDVRFSLRALKSLGLTYAARSGAEKGPDDWGELYAEGLFEVMRRLHRRFGLPIYITETGVPDEHDALRPRWIAETVHQVWRAINFNWPVRGYFFWSLVDNFEWAEGYDPRYRFGLYGVDFQTQERTLRRSGELYAEIARSGALSSDMVRRYAPQAAEKLFPA